VTVLLDHLEHAAQVPHVHAGVAVRSGEDIAASPAWGVTLIVSPLLNDGLSFLVNEDL
jgi:hypothetical protein